MRAAAGWFFRQADITMTYLSRGRLRFPATILSSHIELPFRVLQLPLSFAQIGLIKTCADQPE
jgi:hypothetical protein